MADYAQPFGRETVASHSFGTFCFSRGDYDLYFHLLRSSECSSIIPSYGNPHSTHLFTTSINLLLSRRISTIFFCSTLDLRRSRAISTSKVNYFPHDFTGIHICCWKWYFTLSSVYNDCANVCFPHPSHSHNRNDWYMLITIYPSCHL